MISEKSLIHKPDLGVKVIFERHSQYPTLNFSVLNSSSDQVQITGIHVVKAVSIKDEHELRRFLMGPRTKLDFSLSEARSGTWKKIFGDKAISNLQPSESEAFQLTLECENTINMLDMEIEYLSPGSESSQIASPAQVVIIHSPTPSFSDCGPDTGAIATIDRTIAFQSLIREEDPNLWRGRRYTNCTAWPVAFLRGSAYLCKNNVEEGWKTLRERFEETDLFGPILASFSELLDRHPLSKSVSEYLYYWVQTPAKICKIPIWDEETHSRIVFNRLINHIQDGERDDFIFTTLDKTLYVSNLPKDDNGLPNVMFVLSLSNLRGAALSHLFERHKQACTEFLVYTMYIHDLDIAMCNEILKTNFKQDVSEIEYSKDKLVEFWRTWLSNNQPSNVKSAINWRSKSPRLLRAISTRNNSLTVNEMIVFAKDPDPLIRLSLARNSNVEPVVLEILAKDTFDTIRVSVAKHPKTNIQALRLLAADEDTAVRSWVAVHSQADADLLIMLSEDKDWRVQRSVAANTNTPINILVKLSESKVPAVNGAVIDNPNCPTDLLLKLSQDEQVPDHVRSAALKRLK
jgi:hypothetical protein